MTDKIALIVETTPKRAFASAADWPGWARGGKTEEAALATLAAYAPRYAPVVRRAGLALPREAAPALDVAERLEGGSSTDFGVPGGIAALDRRPSSEVDGKRAAKLVQAAWDTFDEVVAGAPAELRKGPRGGGRDTAKIVEHVVGAELAYARALGLRLAADPTDRRRVAEARRALNDLLAAPSDGSPIGKWPARYAARRIAWHVLDHAWEIEDRSER